VEVVQMTGRSLSVRRESGALESEVLSALWAAEAPVTAAQVHVALQAPELAYKTVLTVVSRLFDKGQLHRKKVGRAFVYWPVRARAEHAAGLMTAVLAGDVDRIAVLQGFVDALAADDEAALRTLLDRSRERRG
jgi:predicted transcriptional regulator